MTITTEMKTALDLIENTKQPVYITGKAGTGKTTLLRYIVSSIKKRFVITASTGIAAVNAGGVTLHSLLHIPFGCLNESTNMGGLPPNKVKLINNIDAIIIDEISMVRPDVLDFIDRKLRAYRVSDKPFGGLQLIMFGDLYQLPPVVKAEEQTILNQFYKGPYFFYAKVFKEIGFTMVELTHIFRQSDPKFIEILNHIRSYRLSPDDMDELAERRDKTNSGRYNTTAIHICTHKAEVQKINNSLLGEDVHTFKAVLKDKFNPNAAPCDMELNISVGARVMMLVNDHNIGYCNGSLGYVTDITQKEDGTPIVTVSLDNGIQTSVEPYKWEANEYKVEDKKIVKTTVGSCTQLPLSLAWAITIHKSQGLTFDKIIVHTKRTFCPGQIYVALSRCTSLEGITLDSFITTKHIFADDELVAFEKAMVESGNVFDKETYKALNA